MNKPVIIFYNPRSGRFNSNKLKSIHASFTEHFKNCELISDKQKLAGVFNSHIVVIGGDGTFHVAINNADLISNTFSLLPAGSGNDFVTAFPKRSIAELCSEIMNGHITECDLIKVGEIFAHTVTGIGFEALVSQKANESRNPIPALKFILPVARYMFSFKPINIAVNGDGFEYSGKAFMLSMGNGKRAGGGFRLFPKAELNDGKMDVLLIKEPEWYEKLLYVWLVNFGRHLKLKVVKYTQIGELKIQLTEKTMLNADGDVYETESVYVKVQKGLLRLIQ